MTFAIIALGVFLAAYGNAMNSVVHRRYAAQAAGKDATTPSRAYRYGAIALISIGIGLTAYAVIWAIWLGKPLPLIG